MADGLFKVEPPRNEPFYAYEPGSPERQELKQEIQKCYNELREIPMVINGQHVTTNDRREYRPPHRLNHTVAHYYYGGQQEVQQAIDAALAAKQAWRNTSWEHRASIFLKAADLLQGPYRQKMNAATMVGQSKNAHQSEIEAVAEFIDFLKFNAYNAQMIYEGQPQNGKYMWNRSDYRPLEGFVYAVTPFNFTSISGNLGAAPAMMGNTVVWKPSDKQIYSAQVIMEVFHKAGLPDGVINMVFADPDVTTDTVMEHPDFAGLHFTGSNNVLKDLWKRSGQNIDKYKSFPRVVGESGGKDFVVMHESADPKEVATSLIRGAFEYQGQKCSAASRAYIPSNRWSKVKQYMEDDLNAIKMGDVDDFTNFINAVIDENAFEKHRNAIEEAKQASDAEIVFGGNCDKSQGYFVEPTVILAHDPNYKTMEQELFGPILTIYVYDEQQFEETLDLVDQTSPYALTGAILSRERKPLEIASHKLEDAAGNFYLNDKPTGSVVGQQSFGGARMSGTNDQAGSYINLIRWTSMRSIKENFVTPTDYTYPFMKDQ
jgi:1-pyrroline-5-carboxylate dehydrogenase